MKFLPFAIVYVWNSSYLQLFSLRFLLFEIAAIFNFLNWFCLRFQLFWIVLVWNFSFPLFMFEISVIFNCLVSNFSFFDFELFLFEISANFNCLVENVRKLQLFWINLFVLFFFYCNLFGDYNCKDYTNWIFLFEINHFPIVLVRLIAILPLFDRRLFERKRIVWNFIQRQLKIDGFSKNSKTKQTEISWNFKTKGACRKKLVKWTWKTWPLLSRQKFYDIVNFSPNFSNIFGVNPLATTDYNNPAPISYVNLGKIGLKYCIFITKFLEFFFKGNFL